MKMSHSHVKFFSSPTQFLVLRNALQLWKNLHIQFIVYGHL